MIESLDRKSTRGDEEQLVGSRGDAKIVEVPEIPEKIEDVKLPRSTDVELVETVGGQPPEG